MAKPTPANKPTPAAAAPSAKPGTAGPEKAKKIAKRVDFVAPEGAAYVNEHGLFTAFPPEYNAKQHLPLKKKQFADVSVFLILQAERYEKQALKLREMAANEGKLSGVKEKAKAKKLLKLRAQFEALQGDLKGLLGEEQLAALLGSIEQSTAAAEPAVDVSAQS